MEAMKCFRVREAGGREQAFVAAHSPLGAVAEFVHALGLGEEGFSADVMELSNDEMGQVQIEDEGPDGEIEEVISLKALFERDYICNEYAELIAGVQV